MQLLNIPIFVKFNVAKPGPNDVDVCWEWRRKETELNKAKRVFC